MQHVPLFFRFEQVVFGRGFMADVRFLGRVTCTRQFGSTWMYGVNPGALAEEGESMRDAYANFRHAIAGVLFDLATEAEDIEQFRTAARSFFEATDDTSVAEWVEAREAIRSGEDPALEGLALRRETGDPDSGFAVEEIASSQAAPHLNHYVPDQPSLLAA